MTSAQATRRRLAQRDRQVQEPLALPAAGQHQLGQLADVTASAPLKL